MTPEEKREYMRAWRAKNPEAVKRHRKKWADKNPEHVAAAQLVRTLRWQAKNPDKVRGVRAKHYAENAEKARRQAAQWRADNPHRYDMQIIRGELRKSGALLQDLPEQVEAHALVRQNRRLVRKAQK